jgi:hypothetical protein
MIDQLKSIGIEKGKPYQPDEATKALLASAAQQAHAWLEAKYSAGFPPFFSPASRWTYPAPLDVVKASQDGFADSDDYPIDSRGLAYSYAFIGIKRLGAGQFYSISIHDKDGNAFDGAQTYLLTVPPKVPVEQYWSVTAYDRETHTLIKNMPRASRSSQIPELQKNPDGAVNIYFGPKAPQDTEPNWVPTDPARQFELMARFYGLKKQFFEKIWKLPDVERVTAQKKSRAMKEELYVRYGGPLFVSCRPRVAQSNGPNQSAWSASVALIRQHFGGDLAVLFGVGVIDAFGGDREHAVLGDSDPAFRFQIPEMKFQML